VTISDGAVVPHRPDDGHRRADVREPTGLARARSSTSVAAKVAAIMWAVTETQNPTLSDIARYPGLPRSTTHRLLMQLVTGQLLERGPSGRYRACRALRARTHTTRIERAAEVRAHVENVLDDLGVATGRRARFGVWSGTDLSYLERPAGMWVRACHAGLTPLPPHATALGRMLLAHAPPAHRGLVLRRGHPSRSTLITTITGDVDESLAVARRNGLAVVLREEAHCIGAAAVAVRGPGGTVVGALELTFDDLVHDLPRARAALLIAARGLERDLAARTGVLPSGIGDSPLDWRADPTSPALSWSEPEVAG
jgi:DNA-binding IclR family transcriptional regulator